MTGSTTLDVLLFLYAVIAPGVAIAALVLRTTDPLVLGAVGATIGIFGLPLCAFVVAVIFGTHISLSLAVGLGTVVLAITGGVYLWLRRRRSLTAAPSGS